MAGTIDDGTERQKLANNLTVAGVLGITVISALAISFSEKRGEAAEHVMVAVLPLFGSWVATVLAYYFARENLKAATSSMSALVTSQRRGGLDQIPVTDKMIERSRFVTLSDRFTVMTTALLKDITAYLKDRGVRRAPVLDGNGAIVYMVHASTLDQYIRDAVTAGKTLDSLTFGDVLGVPALKLLLQRSFELVAETATLQDARDSMQGNPSCEDVFVTRTGAAGEPVIGWITDNAILSAET